MADKDIGSLTLQVSANAKSATTSINNLKTSLDGLKNTVSGMTGLTDVAAQMRFLVQGMNSMSGAADSFKAFKSVASSIKSTLKSLKELDHIDLDHATEQISQLCSTLGMLGEVNKAQGFTSTINALKKLPSVAQDLNNMDIYEFAGNIIEISGALEPLASQIDRISSGFGQLPQRLNSLNAASGRAATGVSRFGTVMSRVFSYVVVRRVANVISGWIKKSTEYVEDLNLFTVAMGRYADSAQEYAEKVSEVMGIDVAQWMRAQGVFATLATGFGVSADRAAIMSKNLTQLAYDLSSFYNLDVDKAMQKLESGFAGEIEPVRRLGYDLSKTTLQATAADLGITKLFADMTQAEKSQLRYYALMTQVTQVQGDMARTLTAPANQLRILSAQLEMAKRALGNIFIPALNAVLPYLIAFAKFVRLVADEIARFFGYTLPEIDYSDISMGVGEVEDSVEDLSGSLGHASGRAKELKGLLASFDQLNIIQSETGGGSGGGSGGIGGLGSDGWVDFDLPQYDFLKNVLASKADAIFERMKKTLDKMRPILRFLVDNFDKILTIALGIVAVLTAPKLGAAVSRLLTLISDNAAALLKGLGVGMIIGGFSLEFSGAYNIGAGKARLWDYIKTALGAALGIGGSLLVFGTGPLGWTIGIGIALTAFITGFAIGEKQRTSELIANEVTSLFTGAIDSVDYASIVADRFSNITAPLNIGLEIAGDLKSGKVSLQGVMTEIDNYILKISGVGKLTDGEVTQMNDALARLETEGGKYISNTYDLLENGLLRSLAVLPEEAATAVEGYLTALSELESDEEKALHEYNEQISALLNEALTPGISAEAKEALLLEAADLRRKAGLLTGTYVDAVSEWEIAKNTHTFGFSVDDINFSDTNAIFTYFDQVTGAYDEARQKIEDYWKAEILTATEKLNYYTAIGDTENANIWKGTLELFKLSKNVDLNTLQEEFDRETLPILQRIADHRDEMVHNVFVEQGPNFGETFLEMFTGASSSDMAVDRITKEINSTYLEPIARYLIDNGTPEVAAATRDMLEGGFVKPFSDVNPDIANAAKDAGENAGTSFYTSMANKIAAGTTNVALRLKNWWRNIRPTSGDSSNPFTWGNIEMQPFASGGYPTRGSLFLAGENTGNPELVGSMGGATAVANGSQIVAGIAAGVYQANAEQNRLLREQNALLRQIAQNGGNVVFSPSPEAGRAISYAMDMYATQRGY